MSVLQNQTKNQILIRNLQTAEGFLQRGLGLIPRKSLGLDEGLLIHQAPTIHTCFMSFPIDCVFVDKNLKVQALVENIKPWRFTKYYWRAHSVIELAAGSIKRLNIQVGDQLHVGH
jgi:uncharacterized protein